MEVEVISVSLFVGEIVVNERVVVVVRVEKCESRGINTNRNIV